MLFFTTLCTLIPLAFAAHSQQFTFHGGNPSTPKAPQLQYLFTAELKCLPNVAPVVPGPHGIRLSLPILGGTFKGINGMNGSILGSSADWVLIDPQTGIGSADARWIISLPPTKSTGQDNALIYVFSTGPSQKIGGLNRAHLRLVFETGVPEYYYFNNVLAVGVLEILNPSNTSVQTVHIDAFNFKDDWSASDHPVVVG